jgi:hypothetical protein
LSERRRGARCQTEVSGYYCGLWWSDGVVHGRRVLPLRCAASPASAFGLPESFELLVRGKAYRAEIVRRGKGHVIVRFT